MNPMACDLHHVVTAALLWCPQVLTPSWHAIRSTWQQTQAEPPAARKEGCQMNRIALKEIVKSPLGLNLTEHAQQRMNARRLPAYAVQAVMTYGRLARVRGAEVFAIGRKEVKRYRKQGIDLKELEGVHVVCGRDGAVLTAYRNHDLRGLKPRGLARWMAA